MDQLSIPYRIALVGLLAVGALYLLVLKPKDEPVPATPAAVPAATTAGGTAAPGVKGLSTAVGKAKGAAAAQASSDAATQAASGGSASAPAPAKARPVTAAGATRTTTSAAAAASASSDPSRAILAELAQGHTAVVLFAGREATDDRAVRAAVGRVDRRGGQVDVHVVPISRVGAYEAITRGVTVLQAPTVLVIGKQRTARTVVGFTTTGEIDQLVADVRRAG